MPTLRDVETAMRRMLEQNQSRWQRQPSREVTLENYPHLARYMDPLLLKAINKTEPEWDGVHSWKQKRTTI